MKTDVNYYDFRDAFEAYDRLDNFSPEGLEMLYNSLIDFEEDTGEELTLDVVALCCEFDELEASDVIDAYGYPADDWRTYLEDNTFVVGYTRNETVVYACF